MSLSSIAKIKDLLFTPGTIVCQGEDGLIPCGILKQVQDDTKIIGVISTAPGFLGGTETSDSVKVAFIGQVPVKISSSSASIKPGDTLVPDPNHPGFAMKATKSGYSVGKALQGWTGSGDRILAYLNVSYAVISRGSDPADLSDLQGPTLSEDWTNIDIATISGDLKVLGLTELANTNIGGNLQVGLLHFDDVKAEISSLTGLVTVVGDLKVTGKVIGNDTMRGELSLKPGGESTVSAQIWMTMPKSVVVTPTFKTSVWITELDKNGFTVNVDPAPTQDEKLYWQAIW